MLSETENPRPLDSEEVKRGIAQLVADAVYEGLAGCNLYGCCYPKFKTAEPIKIKLLLDTSFLPGDEFDNYAVVDNHEVSIAGDPGPDAKLVEVEVDIPAQPPNAFRKDTDQPIAVTAIEDGNKVAKTVKYAPRRGPGRPKKEGK